MRIPPIPIPTLLASFPLLLGGGLGAQVTASFSTETDVGVFADTSLDAVATKTAIATGIQLGASSTTASATARASVIQRSGQFHGVHVHESAKVDGQATKGVAGTCATTDPKSITPAPHSFLLQLGGAQVTSIDVGMSSQVTGSPRASVAVDVGADGRVEFSHAVDGKTWVERLPVPSGKVLVRITISGSAGPGDDYAVDVKVVPGATKGSGCALTRYGPTCPTTLDASDSPTSGNHVVTLKIGQALPNAPIAIVVGLRQTKVPVPGTSCLLLTDPLVLVGTQADAMGAAQVVVRFSLSIPAQGYMQAVPFDARRGVIVTSNGLQVDCR